MKQLPRGEKVLFQEAVHGVIPQTQRTHRNPLIYVFCSLEMKLVSSSGIFEAYIVRVR